MRARPQNHYCRRIRRSAPPSHLGRRRMAARPDRCKLVIDVGPGHSFPQMAQGLVGAALFWTRGSRLDGEPQLFRAGELGRIVPGDQRAAGMHCEQRLTERFPPAGRASAAVSSATSAASQRILGDIEAATRRTSRTVSSGSRPAIDPQARSCRCCCSELYLVVTPFGTLFSTSPAVSPRSWRNLFELGADRACTPGLARIVTEPGPVQALPRVGSSLFGPGRARFDSGVDRWPDADPQRASGASPRHSSRAAAGATGAPRTRG